MKTVLFSEDSLFSLILGEEKVVSSFLEDAVREFQGPWSLGCGFIDSLMFPTQVISCCLSDTHELTHGR